MTTREECDRKVPYPSRHAAVVAMRQLQRRTAKKDRLSVFLCTVCRGYHVGHTPKRLG